MADAAEVQVEEAPAAPTRTSVYEASKEIAIRKEGAVSVPMPTTFAQMQDFASTMSRGGPMVGKPFRDNPGACLAILTQSMRWGMDPYAVSQKAYVAAQNGDGPIGYEGQLVAAVVQAVAPLQKRLRCEYAGEGDKRTITVIGYLKGEDEPFTYTSPPLDKLRPTKNSSGYLKGSQLWETDPDQQLWYYGVRAWSRKWTPDVIMGVYTPDEIVDGGVIEARREGSTMSLVADEPVAAEAEYTPIDGLLNRANSPKPNKESAAPKDGAKAVGDGGVSPKEDGKKGKASRAKAGSQPQAGADQKDDASRTQQQGGGSEPKAADAETATGPADAGSDETDAQLVARIETEVKEAKTGKRDRILAARGALTRISETADDQDLRKRAVALLNRYELDDQ